ncbi:MAG: Hsp20/alpha crystallin family protein [candidate division Zixibacteria bacterium]|nr:Hsp20/alpha crystallin family protein [candidate division Zixibacteria bacterium]
MFSIVKREPKYNWGVMNLRNEIDRMFRSFYEDSESSDSHWMPSVDIIDEKDKLLLTAEIPGVEKKDVKINLQNNVLSIEGEKKQEHEEKDDDYYRSERFYGKFCRSFTLSSDVDSDNIQADFDNGVLTVTMPKSEKVKPRQIEIK